MAARTHFLQPLVEGDASRLALVVAGRPTCVASSLEPAFDSRTRTRGLRGRAVLADDAAVILAPCFAVHTFGMRFPIDVVFAARDGRVVKIRHAVPRSRLAIAVGAFTAIEMPAGAAERTGLRVGDRLEVVSASAERDASIR